MNQKGMFVWMLIFSALSPLSAENEIRILSPKENGIIRNREVSQWGAFLQLQSDLKQDQLYRLTGEIRSLSGVQEYTLSVRSSIRNNDRGTAGTDFASFCWYLRPEKTGSTSLLIGNAHSKQADLEFRNLKLSPLSEEEWRKNIFPDSEFECSAEVPGFWRKTGSGDRCGQIVKSDFIGGDKSLELKGGKTEHALERPLQRSAVLSGRSRLPAEGEPDRDHMGIQCRPGCRISPLRRRFLLEGDSRGHGKAEVPAGRSGDGSSGIPR